jgi:hypothetical protein
MPINSNQLTLRITEALQISAQVYMRNQEIILEGMKATMNQIKKLEQDLEINMEKLQNDSKKAQQALQKGLNQKSKALKEQTEDQKRILNKKMEQLTELNQDAQKKYFESQENAISQYKKKAKAL